jgi:hypothetical protein
MEGSILGLRPWASLKSLSLKSLYVALQAYIPLPGHLYYCKVYAVDVRICTRRVGQGAADPTCSVEVVKLFSYCMWELFSLYFRTYMVNRMQQ